MEKRLISFKSFSSLCCYNEGGICDHGDNIAGRMRHVWPECKKKDCPIWEEKTEYFGICTCNVQYPTKQTGPIKPYRIPNPKCKSSNHFKPTPEIPW